MKRNEFKKAVQLFLNSKSGATCTAYKTTLQRLEQFSSEEINQEELQRFFNSLELSTNTKHQYYIRLRTFFDFCVKMGFCEQNFMLLVDDIKVKKSEIKHTFLNRNEIEQIFNAKIWSEQDLKRKALTVFAIQTGLRNNELRNLQVKDLDFVNSRVLVQNGKGSKKRFAPFPKLSQDLVKRLIEQNGIKTYVFGKHDKQVSLVAMNGLVKRYVKNTVNRDISIHSLRHTAASLWDDLGVPIRIVQQALGHSSIATTEQIYINVLNKEKASSEIVNAFEKENLK